VKLGKPTPTRAAGKPKGADAADAKRGKRVRESDLVANAGTGGGAASAERIELARRIGEARANGEKWSSITERTGISLAALARLRKFAKANGIPGYTRD
jgi:hypothetical protein